MIDHRNRTDTPMNRPEIVVDQKTIDPFSIQAAAGRIAIVANLLEGADVITNRMPMPGTRWHVLLPRKGDATMRYARMEQDDGTLHHRFECSSIPYVMKDCAVSLHGPPMDPHEYAPTVDTATFASHMRMLSSLIADIDLSRVPSVDPKEDEPLAAYVAERMQEDFPTALPTFDTRLRISRYPTFETDVSYAPTWSKPHVVVPVLKPCAAALLPTLGETRAGLTIDENGPGVEYVLKGVSTIAGMPERTGDTMRRLRLAVEMPLLGDAPWTDEFVAFRTDQDG